MLVLCLWGGSPRQELNGGERVCSARDCGAIVESWLPLARKRLYLLVHDDPGRDFVFSHCWTSVCGWLPGTELNGGERVLSGGDCGAIVASCLVRLGLTGTVLTKLKKVFLGQAVLAVTGSLAV